MPEKDNLMTRKDFLKNVGIFTAGTVLLTSTGGLLYGCSPEEAATSNGNGIETPEWPFPYKKIDPDLVAERAYEGYKEGHG
ncbi:MAG: hypothetical protein R6U91_03345 [Bacillota bacterium]